MKHFILLIVVTLFSFLGATALCQSSLTSHKEIAAQLRKNYLLLSSIGTSSSYPSFTVAKGEYFIIKVPFAVHQHLPAESWSIISQQEVVIKGVHGLEFFVIDRAGRKILKKHEDVFVQNPECLRGKVGKSELIFEALEEGEVHLQLQSKLPVANTKALKVEVIGILITVKHALSSSTSPDK